MLERNIMGDMQIYRQLGTKPNFSEMGRRYDLDRHTVAKYWDQGSEVADGRSDRRSSFEPFLGTIITKASTPGITKKAVYEFLIDRYPDAGLSRYSAFTEFCRKHDIRFGDPCPDAHPRFETPPGRQLQFDWKEDIRMTDVNGVVFEFNTFSATLGCSRMHKFTYSPTRTEDDLLGCLLGTFTFLGGVPEEAVTDNMSALVTFVDGKRRRSERAWRFAKEAGFELRLCKPGAPETKGKDESANRFLDRLLAYDHDFEGLGGLLDAIARIEARSNAEPNDTTGIPPAVLFAKEKEALRPIGNLAILRDMVGKVSVQVVPSTMLVRAAGRQWSVPRECIGRKVNVTAMPSGGVRVTMGGRLVACHDASEAKGPIVYSEDHYAEALDGKAWFGDADIRDAARSNLDLLEGLGEDRG